MNQRKTNNTLWYSLGLAMLLCAAFLVSATGTTLARYRAERKATITFQVRPPAQTSLGVVRTLSDEEAAEAGVPVGTEIFDPSIQPQWETVDETLQLNLAVANGISAEDFSEKEQTVRLQMIATLGAAASDVYLRLPSGEPIKAAVSAIEAGSTLYATHGAGWLYTFLDAEGNELTWTLPGGTFAYLKFTLTMKSAERSSDSLLQPQVIAELVTQ